MALLQQSPPAFRVAVAITAHRDGTTGQLEGQTILSYSRQSWSRYSSEFLASVFSGEFVESGQEAAGSSRMLPTSLSPQQSLKIRRLCPYAMLALTTGLSPSCQEIPQTVGRPDPQSSRSLVPFGTNQHA